MRVSDASKLQIGADGELYIDLETPDYKDRATHVFSQPENLAELLEFITRPKDHPLFAYKGIIDRTAGDAVKVKPEHNSAVVSHLATLITSAYPLDDGLILTANQIHIACGFPNLVKPVAVKSIVAPPPKTTDVVTAQ